MFTLESRLKQSLCTLLGVPADQQWVDLVKTVNSYGFLSVRMPKKRATKQCGKNGEIEKKNFVQSLSYSSWPRRSVWDITFSITATCNQAAGQYFFACRIVLENTNITNQQRSRNTYFLYFTLSLHFSSTLLIQISSLVHCLNDTFRGVFILSSTTSFCSYERNILRATCIPQ